MRTHHLLNFGYGNHGVQAVRGQHPALAHDGVQGLELQLGGGVNVTEHAHNHVLMRVVLGLLRGNAALVQQALHEGVVGRNLLELTVGTRAQAVCTRVTDVGKLDAIAVNQQRGAGGAHTGKLRVVCGQLVNNQVGALNLIGQVNAAGAVLKVGVVQRGQV